MDTRYRSYLLGLNKDQTKMNEYINSDNFRENRELSLQSGLFEKTAPSMCGSSIGP